MRSLTAWIIICNIFIVLAVQIETANNADQRDELFVLRGRVSKLEAGRLSKIENYALTRLRNRYEETKDTVDKLERALPKEIEPGVFLVPSGRRTIH